MIKFKIGDRVHYHTDPKTEGTITEVYRATNRLQIDFGRFGSLVYPYEAIRLVAPSAEETNNPTSPNVYKFPNCEVKDISQHLTSNGGQAMQYVVRATRLDGLHKDDKVQDLEKALVMIQWEIARLNALQ